MDCCRFVTGRLWGNDVVDSGDATSVLEEVLESESMLEVARCNGRGGNECRLVGVVISKRSGDSISATVGIGIEYEGKGTKGSSTYQLETGTGDVFGG